MTDGDTPERNTRGMEASIEQTPSRPARTFSPPTKKTKLIHSTNKQ